MLYVCVRGVMDVVFSVCFYIDEFNCFAIVFQCKIQLITILLYL